LLIEATEQLFKLRSPMLSLRFPLILVRMTANDRGKPMIPGTLYLIERFLHI
jgi:hypothetical protein